MKNCNSVWGWIRMNPQFSQVLNVELDQIIEACKFLDETWNPRISPIVAQKNRYTKFFKKGSPDNDLCMEFLWLEVFESFIQRCLFPAKFLIGNYNANSQSRSP